MGRRAPILIAGALAAVAAVVAIVAQYRHDLAHARVRVSIGTVAQTACGPIEYATLGGGPPVLVVHGAGGGFDQGIELFEPLAGRGLRLVAMSRFGYLRTPLPADASAEKQADAHACLMDALGIPSAAVIGASAGAPSAMQLAIRHPQRVSALALVVPAAYRPRNGGPSLDTPPRTPLLMDTALRSDFLMWTAVHAARRLMVRGILGTPPELLRDAGADEQARVERALQHILPVTARRAGLMNDAAIVSTLRRYELERIAAPTLLVGFADDLYGTFEAARYTASQVRGARMVAFPDGGHLAVGHENEMTAEVAAFLRTKVAPPAPG